MIDVIIFNRSINVDLTLMEYIRVKSLHGTTIPIAVKNIAAIGPDGSIGAPHSVITLKDQTTVTCAHTTHALYEAVKQLNEMEASVKDR
jgi:4-hydroxy-L-threonine phosphate dehydrogenase PdxA